MSDITLKGMISTGRLVIKPLGKNAIQSASIDCRLGNHYLEIELKKAGIITLDSPIDYKDIIANALTIPPRSFLLATTLEHIKMPDDVTAFVEGRSSIGRMGLFIQNAGWIDPGFEGKITLELYNANTLPIKLKAGRRICQLVFCRLDRPARHPYNGKYQGQKKPVGSRIFEDFEVLDKKSNQKKSSKKHSKHRSCSNKP